MKILHLIQKKQRRGAEIFTAQLGNHQLVQGHEVRLIALFFGQANLPFEGEIISLDRSGKRRLVDVEGWQQLAQHIREFQPDIVQANAGDTLKYAVFSKLFCRWKAPIIFRNASTVSQYIKNPLVKLLNALLYKNTAHVISVSAASRGDLNNLFRTTKAKTTVIPIGIEINALATEAIHFDPAYFHILHIGGFSFEKNHAGLLHIFKMLQQSYPDVQLHLIGDGSLREEVENMSVSLGLQNAITFHGAIEQPLDYIQAAQVLVLPSILEGLPGAILEAQYCKTPVVANNVGGISEIVQNNHTGWLVEKGDEEAFAEAIQEVIKAKPEDLKQITDAAYQQVVEQYDNRVIAERFVEVYEGVAKAQRK